MIRKTEITHGALFAIPMWNDLGYLYGKLLLGLQLKKPEVSKHNRFVRVYDHYTKELAKDFDKDFFKGYELFVDPFILAALPKLKGKDSWKFLRHDSIYEEDEFVHH